MVPKVKDILDLIEEIAPFDTAEDWDNSGLQIGSYSSEVRKLFLSLDPTLKAVKEASERKAQLLLTHHPLIFKPLLQLRWDVFPGNVIYEALNEGISIATAHTNIDIAAGGINDILANLFHLQDTEVLQPSGGEQRGKVGLGRIGNLPEPMTLSSMIKEVKEVIGAEPIKAVGNKNLKIRRVAVVGGSGGGLVSAASVHGADLLITGDVGHHEALEALNRGLALIDGGHFYTEKEAFTQFGHRLKNLFKERGWDVSSEIYLHEKSPMHPD